MVTSHTHRHNEVRDMTGSLLKEVCHGVSTEPHLQPLSGKQCSMDLLCGGRCKIGCCSVRIWGGMFKKAFLDVRVFKPSA